MKFAALALAAALAMLPAGASAQTQYPTLGAANGQSSGTTVPLCVDTNGNAQPNNIDYTLVTLTAAAAGTYNSPDQNNNCGHGAQVGVNLTTMTTASLVVHIQGKDVASGVYYDLLVSASLSSTGFTNLTVFPGAAVTANVSNGQPLPGTWRISVVVTGASAAATGTVGASVIQ